MTSSVRKVKLLNVPIHRQGTHDGLCAYYTATMMLATFYPSKEAEFGLAEEAAGNFKIYDPMITKYQGEMKRGPSVERQQKNRNMLARWFYQGPS